MVTGKAGTAKKTGTAKVRSEQIDDDDGLGIDDDDDGLSLHEAVDRFRLARVKGLESWESVRRACAVGRIRNKKLGRKGYKGRPTYRIKASEIERIIAVYAEEDDGSVHKKLIDFYRADELHNPILAVANGLSKSIDEASRVYRLFKQHAGQIAAFDAREKQRTWEAEQSAQAAKEKPCETCSRTYFVALRDSATLVAVVTGHAPSLQAAQFERHEHALIVEHAAHWRCTECGLWRTGAPASEMRATLAAALNKKDDEDGSDAITLDTD